MISDAFPRFSLIDGPTPLQRMVRLEKETGHGSLWVKRDDCMPLGLGGNKLRSLEFWLGQALNEGCDTLLVAGGIASNQCRLTAAAAAKSGLDCVILYAGDEPTRYEGNLLLSEFLGAKLHFIGPVSEEERGRQALQMAETLRKLGKKPISSAIRFSVQWVMLRVPLSCCSRRKPSTPPSAMLSWPGLWDRRRRASYLAPELMAGAEHYISSVLSTKPRSLIPGCPPSLISFLKKPDYQHSPTGGWAHVFMSINWEMVTIGQLRRPVQRRNVLRAGRDFLRNEPIWPRRLPACSP